MINVILCGGSGVRLWPLSRQSKPKQFIDLLHETSLLQRAAQGNKPLTSGCVIVCNQAHSHLVQQQMNGCSVVPKHYIFEPIGRNSAAAVCLALLSIDPEEIAFMTPADLYIEYSEEYRSALQKAQKLASQDHIVIFGITPKGPETGYGYIELSDDEIVKRFHEKPTLDVAQEYIRRGNFFWNSGMICAKAKVLLNAMQKYAPAILEQAKRTYNNAKTATESSTAYYLPLEQMEKIPSTSIDYALFEKMNDLKMVRGNFVWSDIGSFDSLFHHLEKDGEGNAGSARSVKVDSKHNLIIGGDRLIATIDVENLIIVDTPDALLVSKMGSAQKVRNVVDKLDESAAHLQKVHLEENRPWGTFTVLESFEGWKVKRLTVNPGKRLSLQKHKFRAEHWVVVSGKALVTVGDNQTLLHPNQSIFIPLGEIHRIENPGEELCVIIEVQCGSYTGEDDIIRFQDDFCRPVEATT